MRTILLFFLLIVSACAQQKDVLLYKQNQLVPTLVVEEESLNKNAEIFQRLFQTSTGEIMKLSSKLSGNNSIILSYDKSIAIHDFHLRYDRNKLIIAGANNESILRGIYYFYLHYMRPHTNSEKPIQEIYISNSLNLNSKEKFDFEYREPYFMTNFDAAFRTWNNTQTLEEEWGIWGHNIHKHIKPTAEMYALVNGKPQDEQYNFSSEALYQALVGSIQQLIENEPSKSKFMILPNDNSMVCQCDKCEKLGNTATNANPAVLTFVNKLAKRFPNLTFFSSSYVSTSQYADIKMEKNTAIMISSMDFPKAIIFNNYAKKDAIINYIKQWEKNFSKIYLWDYAINFDNYFDAYPTLSIAQENLKFYKTLGIKGIFMQANEEGYSAFEDIKSYAYAQLLQNTEIDLKSVITTYCRDNYGPFGDKLAAYYLSIEQRAYASKMPLDIYSGIKNAKLKYLEESAFTDFYKALYQEHQANNNPNKSGIQKLLLAFSFQKLELNRVNSKQYDQENLQLIDQLDALREATKINSINESGYTLVNYINQWRNLLAKPKINSVIHGVKFQALSQLDEDYKDIGILTDNAIGFTDYYTNWHITSGDDLTVEMPITPQLLAAREISFNFLNDPKHKIRFPESIEIRIDDKKYSFNIVESAQMNEATLKSIQLPINFVADNKKLTIRINKNKKGAIACDEISIQH